ncbi:MAG: 50S ribosomal protein L31 [Candidatus Wildermuthbacteria bacterium]|nr:50S ribosomal protein L31 [Candidatus Wildermuthbacteria bacterium]
MKKDIHPIYYPKAKVECACGNTFTIGSTKELIQVEVCSACHPLYTGKEKTFDKVGRVQKFKERVTKASSLKEKSKTTAKKGTRKKAR